MVEYDSLNLFCTVEFNPCPAVFLVTKTETHVLEPTGKTNPSFQSRLGVLLCQFAFALFPTKTLTGCADDLRDADWIGRSGTHGQGLAFAERVL